MKKLSSLTGVITLGRTAQKSINGGSGVQSCPAGSQRRRGICGSTCSELDECGLGPNSYCGGGEIVNGCCYVCV